MLPYPYLTFPTFARREPLNHITLNDLFNNVRHVDLLAAGGHTPAGEHNTPVVARAGGRVAYSAGYTLTGWNAYASLETGHNPTPGRVIITLDTGMIDADLCTMMVSPDGAQPESKPVLVGVDFTSDTTVEVHMKYLTSALGAGNAWAVLDDSFSFAIHSRKWQASGANIAAFTKSTRFATLQASAQWNAIVTSQAYLKAQVDLEHDGTGEHDVETIARGVGFLEWDGTDYTSDHDWVNSIVHNSTGIVTVTTRASLSDSSVFPTVDWARTNPSALDTDFHIINTKRIDADEYRFYIYKYDPAGDTWGRADADFFFAHHGTP